MIKMNKSTRLNVSVFGSIFGLSGICHGFFETLQGFKPASSMFIMAIGDAQRMWIHGNEPAFTIIPNYLISGIVSILLGLCIMIWAIKYVHLKYGSLILLILFISSFLTGGGIAQVLFFPWIWFVSTKINKSLENSKKESNDMVNNILIKNWPVFLFTAAVFLVSALTIAVTGYIPGMSNQDVVLSIMLILLGLFIIFFILSFISGLKRDSIKRA